MNAKRRWWYSIALPVVLAVVLLGFSQGNPAVTDTAVVAQPQLPLELQEPPAHRIKAGSAGEAQEFTLPILAYHRVCNGDSDAKCVKTADLERQLIWLKLAGYQTISFEDLMKWELGIGLMPKKPVILTFDDGYLDNYTILYPMLQQKRMKATVFLTSHFIGTQGYLSWHQVKRMEGHGIEFGAHTQTHQNLTQLTSWDQKYEEITGCKREIERKTGRPVLSFAYPYGFYDDESLQIVKAAGYQYAVTGQSGYATPRTEPWSLKRIVISGYTEMDVFKKKLP